MSFFCRTYNSKLSSSKKWYCFEYDAGSDARSRLQQNIFLLYANTMQAHNFWHCHNKQQVKHFKPLASSALYQNQNFRSTASTYIVISHYVLTFRLLINPRQTINGCKATQKNFESILWPTESSPSALRPRAKRGYFSLGRSFCFEKKEIGVKFWFLGGGRATFSKSRSGSFLWTHELYVGLWVDPLILTEKLLYATSVKWQDGLKIETFISMYNYKHCNLIFSRLPKNIINIINSNQTFQTICVLNSLSVIL